MGTRRGASGSVACLVGLLLGARPSAGAEADDSVRVVCDQLPLEDAAEVEARIRTTLLTAPAPRVHVGIACDRGVATVTATASGLTETATVPLPNPQLKDALLNAVERTLLALEQAVAAPSAPAPTETPTPRPASPPRAAPVNEPRHSRDAKHNFRVGAHLLGELWNDELAYGGRASLEMGRIPWAVGLALGGLVSREQASAFVPTEWHTFVFGVFEAPTLANLRGSAGIGASVLVATPRSGISPRSATTLTGLFVDVGLARPFPLGRVALVPALHLRTFPIRREIRLDAERRLALPLLAPSVLLGLTYRLD